MGRTKFLKHGLGFLTLGLIVVLHSCQPKVTAEKDSPNDGEINFSIDETLKPIIEAELDIFSASYPSTKINAHYKTQNACIADLVNDSTQLICISRELNDNEKKVLLQKKFDPPVYKIALDAIALVVNKSDADTTITTEEFKKILSGDRTDKRLVFDNSNSSTVNFLMDYYKLTKLPATAFATQSNTEAIKYVSETPNAVGVIGWCWLSDSDDAFTKKSFEKIKVLSIKLPEQKTGLKPFQINLADKQYPFFRDVNLIPKEHRNNLATSFANFAIGDIGQTIILKSGLVPTNQPPRILQFKEGKVGKVKS